MSASGESTTQLDGWIGKDAWAQSAPSADSEPVLHVAIRGEGLDQPWAENLAADVQLLIEWYVRGDRSRLRELVPPTVPAEPGSAGSIELALHSLNLDGEAQDELRSLIARAIERRVAGSGAG